MNYTNDDVKKICNFYMSDWHFIVMLLPYINKEINRNTNVITILEKDMTDKVKTLVKKLNLKNKEDILKINWNNTDINSFIKELNNNLNEDTGNFIIINGTNHYIEEVNNKINKLLSSKNSKDLDIKIIDCYYFDSNKENMTDILKNYSGMLNTSGEIKIEEML